MEKKFTSIGINKLIYLIQMIQTLVTKIFSSIGNHSMFNSAVLTVLITLYRRHLTRVYQQPTRKSTNHWQAMKQELHWTM